MAVGESNSKYPTWQWIAGAAISIIFLISSVSLTETRSDIRDVKKANAEICDRVTILETANKLQFQAIKEWRDEVRVGMSEIKDRLDRSEREAKGKRTDLNKIRINQS